MKKNAKLTTVLAAALLAGAVLASAEVALDEVVQAGRFVFYRDHADAHKYYYVPDAPRLATKRDGTPEFTFIKYTKTGGETRGGVVHFLVTWGYSSGELSSAEAVLKSTDPQARIAGPVPFKEGTFQVVSATAGEGGLFSRRIVGEGKAPIMPGQKAAVSIALTEEGASLLWESFKNPTSDVSVLFALKFAGVTPAFQAKLKVNWDKVYTHHDVRLQAEGTIKVVKLKAEMQAILDDLRQKGVIQLDVVGENESTQKMLDAVYTHILNMMCEPVPMGAGSAPAPPVKAPATVAELGPPDWSMGVLSDLVRTSGERLRGGPSWDQEQATTARTEPPCDPASKAKWTLLKAEGDELGSNRNFLFAARKYEEAYAVCPMPETLYRIASCYDVIQEYEKARSSYARFLREVGGALGDERGARATTRLSVVTTAGAALMAGKDALRRGELNDALAFFEGAGGTAGSLEALYYSAVTCRELGDRTKDISFYEKARERFSLMISMFSENPFLNDNPLLENLRIKSHSELEIVGARMQQLRSATPPVKPEGQAAATDTARTEQTTAQMETARAQSQTAAEEARRARREAAQGGVQASQTTARQAEQATQQAVQAETGKPPGTVDAGTKPPTGQDATTAQLEQQIASLLGSKPPDATGGTKPPTTPPPAGQTPPAKPAAQTPAAPAAKPAAAAPEVKPIVSVSLGYTFKRVKMSGNYEVDMRKRLREDRDIVMSGNISGVFQKYGEDKRFFTVVSLDDPTFQERSVEVILDGQDAEDFKNYINTVSVLFRKQRFSGAPMTGEVKFFADQFAQSGNRLSFRYGRLNEASTEWLTYEYKPKWSFYGGVEWEGEWTRTSDSVLTLAPPVRRRTLEISVDEGNILKNSVKALAIQVRNRIYGKDILKEVIIDYDKGDPLQARYTYMHEEGSPGYSYKVIWLTTDGREVATDWMNRESPFIYAVFTGK